LIVIRGTGYFITGLLRIRCEFREPRRIRIERFDAAASVTFSAAARAI
jgi:hypothetical protein